MQAILSGINGDGKVVGFSSSFYSHMKENGYNKSSASMLGLDDEVKTCHYCEYK